MIDNLFLSVGAMKAGTTWLYEQLKDHPDVAFTPEKEIHYFANVVGIENQLNYRSRLLKLKAVMEKYYHGNPSFLSEKVDEIAWYAKYANKKEIDNDWYVSLFEGCEKKYKADFSNLYCQMESDGWENVHLVSERVKAVYTLRDPLKRLWSHYKFHHKWVGKEDDVLKDGFSAFKETLKKPWFYKNMDYSGNLKRVESGVGKENLLVLYFEDFRENPQEESDKLCEFLGISKYTVDAGSKDKKVNATKDFDMPDEWRKYAISMLEPYVEEMAANGIVHKKWSVL
ncbi:sulfotransferase [Halomonas meridiana]|uniref:sulfotransferase domain-containing protein n=1 Tax=Vreelandella aquamarina TaxID=77097 RepID=UPI00273BB43F|nr:sulfotransferase domain-containing protein [Halomonas meridiana]MDP4556228.1 sulfotransferase [Halomonas meridiana]